MIILSFVPAADHFLRIAAQSFVFLSFYLFYPHRAGGRFLGAARHDAKSDLLYQNLISLCSRWER